MIVTLCRWPTTVADVGEIVERAGGRGRELLTPPGISTTRTEQITDIDVRLFKAFINRDWDPLSHPPTRCGRPHLSQLRLRGGSADGFFAGGVQ